MKQHKHSTGQQERYGQSSKSSRQHDDAAKSTCSMDPCPMEVSGQTGKCPKCGMMIEPGAEKKEMMRC